MLLPLVTTVLMLQPCRPMAMMINLHHTIPTIIVVDDDGVVSSVAVAGHASGGGGSIKIRVVEGKWHRSFVRWKMEDAFYFRSCSRLGCALSLSRGKERSRIGTEYDTKSLSLLFLLLLIRFPKEKPNRIVSAGCA